ncbi:2OG-Fe(II) oxygenase family protein [Pelagibacteraceae bacterium]|nr:2OG-Fe(II) oxygenase family protein [Pelagibacteraceae bacterium]
MSKPNLLFPTPVWTIQLDNFKKINDEMYKYIKSQQKIDSVGVTKSNVKGWHSNEFDLNEKEPQNFITFILPAIEQVMTDMNWEKQKQIAKINNMWAIINTGGSANLRHQHGNSTISGAYYVKAPLQSGDIVFYDPRPAPVYSHPNVVNPNLLNAQVNSISPKEGALVLFPSYVDHSVNENLSNQERIVISFNIRIQIK